MFSQENPRMVRIRTLRLTIHTLHVYSGTKDAPKLRTPLRIGHLFPPPNTTLAIRESHYKGHFLMSIGIQIREVHYAYTK